MKSQAVNDLIKEIERHEVRGRGVATAACHPIEWDKCIMLLVAARLVFFHCKKAMYMILAVMMLQWHFIGQIDNIICRVTMTIQQKLCQPSCLQLKMRKAKKYQIQVRHTNANFLCVNGSTRPVLNLAVFIEMFGMQGFGQKKIDWKSTLGFSEYLDKLLASSHFKAARTRKLGMHSLHKGPSTYACWFGLLRDWIPLRHHWRSN